MDRSRGFWQVQKEEEDRDQTGFTSHHGLYQLFRMPFEVFITRGILQRTLDVSTSPLKWQLSLVYLDEIIIFSRPVDKRFEHVITVFSLL